MNLNDFIQERKEDWEKLSDISTKFQSHGSSGMTKDEIWDLGRLYMAAVSDLSIIRSSQFGNDSQNPVLLYLNALVIRVHGLIYQKSSFQISSISNFFRHTLPYTVRAESVYLGVSAAMFFLFGIIGYVLGLNEPNFIPLLVPEKIISTVESGKVWFSSLFELAPAASSQLMTHNISVTFLCIASGITFGLGTLYLLGLNGLLIGTVAALCFKHDLSLELWSFVLPHGNIEISAILIGGSAGLIIGHSLIDPGPYLRSDYLKLRSRSAGILALACVPMLTLAGIIEAFLSPSPAPEEIKFLFAITSFAVLIYYLFFMTIEPIKID